MEKIQFSYNWNNKLTNAAFTTLRLHNPRKYQRGAKFLIECNGKSCGVAVLREIRTFKISALNDFITFLDTGYNVNETVKLLQKMYKNKVYDWNAQKFDFCLLVYEKPVKEKQLFD